jgi:arylsulfate sulfotransferase
MGCRGGGAAQLERAVIGATAAVTPAAATLSPGQSQQFAVSVNGGIAGTPTWLVNGAVGGSATTGTISASGMYTAPSSGGIASVQVAPEYSEQGVQVTGAQVTLFSASSIKPGTVMVSPTIPLVALYTVTAPAGATAKVDFGTSQNYGLSTSEQAAPAAGGDTTVIVAGMRASSTYHMRATVTQADGTQVVDSDKTFATGAIPAEELPDLVVQQAPGASPADGLEILSLDQDTTTPQLTAVVTDLQGNVVWYYPVQPQFPFPIKPLPNGHVLVLLYQEIREIDLAGNLIYGLPLVQVHAALAAQGMSLPTFSSFDHDVLKLANGHYMLLITYTQAVTDPPGSGNVAGNLIVEWDPQTQKPVWTWNAFDHLQVAHAPFGLPDWTHANALLYSPDDGNLIVSMRNQDWILKLNYADGAGDGSVLWRMGPDGDFTLPAGAGPVEWNYGQHYPVFVSPNSAGVFSMMIFNNGVTRYEDAAKTLCGDPATPCYSSVPIFQLDETTKQMKVLAERDLLPAWSFCCGSVGMMSNGNWEFDVAADVNTPNVSTIREETPPPASEPVWQMQVSGELVYRGMRIPSLYPGVTWSQAALNAAHAGATPSLRATTKSPPRNETAAQRLARLSRY